MTFLPRTTDTLFLHQHDKNLWIEFEDFQQIMSQTQKWFKAWKKTNKHSRNQSLEEFVLDQEAFLKREYGEDRFALAQQYVLLSSIFQIAITTAAQRPEKLWKLWKAVKSFV